MISRHANGEDWMRFSSKVMTSLLSFTLGTTFFRAKILLMSQSLEFSKIFSANGCSFRVITSIWEILIFYRKMRKTEIPCIFTITEKERPFALVSSHMYRAKMDKQCHGSYVTEREKDALRGTRTTHLLLSGQMS